MALLAATQGTPERLWAIVSILTAHGGSLSRDDLQKWLKPRFDGINNPARNDKDLSLVSQAIQAATGLGVIESGRDPLTLAPSSRAADIDAFADVVHGLLIAQAPGSADADILDAFACAVVHTEIVGNRQWLCDSTASQIADLLSESMTPRAVESTDLRFNKSRPPTWTRWLEFVGLNETLSSQRTLLSVTNRLRRTLAMPDFAWGEPIDAQTFLAWLATRMPYLDQGALYLAASKRMGHAGGPTLTRLLSAALRDLHEDDLIRLITPRGDAQSGVRMAADKLAKVSNFSAVVLNEDLADG